MSGHVSYRCPEPGCDWSWTEINRPVGQGLEFERRLARRAELRDGAVAEHRQEHAGPAEG